MFWPFFSHIQKTHNTDLIWKREKEVYICLSRMAETVETDLLKLGLKFMKYQYNLLE